MKSTVLALILGLAASTPISAQPVRWTTYTIPQTGTSVDFPASIFTEEAGRPDGYGQRFRTADGRADLTVKAAPNVSNDSPAAFLARKHPPSRIQYKRVTPGFSPCRATRPTRSGTTAATSPEDWFTAS
jgi:hypothetical protein